MRLLSCLLFSALVATAQNTVTIIPSTNSSTGAPQTPGVLVFRDLSTPAKTLSVEAPTSISSSYSVVLNTEPSAAGCLVSSAIVSTVVTWTVDPTCTGISITATPPVTYTSGVIACANCDTLNTTQTITGAKTFTTSQTFEDYVEFDQTGGGLSWSIEGLTSNQLSFRDSSSMLRMYLNASGFAAVGGSGIDLVTPSVYAGSTSSDSPALVVTAYSSPTADIMDVASAGLGTKYFWIDSTGLLHDTMGVVTSSSGSAVSDTVNNTAAGGYSIYYLEGDSHTYQLAEGGSSSAFPGEFYIFDSTNGAVRFVIGATGAVDIPGALTVGSCATCSASDMMTTDTNQTVTGIKLFKANQQIGYGAWLQFLNTTGGGNWQIDGNNGSSLDFRDSSSVLRAYLDASGAASVGGSGVDFVSPSIYAGSTASNSPALVVAAYSSPTADIMDVTSVGMGTKYLWVDSAGATHIYNCAAGCSGGVTSVSGSSPIASSGGTNPNISCSTCLTTAGGQTITSADTFSAGSYPLIISPSLQEIYSSVNDSWNIGDSTHGFGAIYAGDTLQVNGTGSDYIGFYTALHIFQPANGVWSLGDSGHYFSAGYIDTLDVSGVTTASGGVLSGAGISATGYNINGGIFGVSCSGSPSGSFASVGGIVTHC